MLAVKTRPNMRTIKKEKIISHILNFKRDLEKEKKLQELLNDVLKMIE